MGRIDEPLTDEQAEQMERGLRRLLRTPPQPHGKNPKAPPPPKSKERPASKGRVHKGNRGADFTRSTMSLVAAADTSFAEAAR
jgi:hypothetical protein